MQEKLRLTRKAVHARSVASESADARGRYYAYRIHPPAHAPFLPSEEAIITFVESYPELTYLKTEREPDRDILIVKVSAEANMFRSHATSGERVLRTLFLRDVASRSVQLRDIPEYIQNACQEYLESRGFCALTWKPYPSRPSRSHFMFLRADGVCVPSWRVSLTPDAELRKLKHTCAPYPPFTYEAAPL